MVGMEGLMRMHTALWRRCDGRRGPRLRRCYTPFQQARREQAAERFLAAVEPQLGSRAEYRELQSAIVPAFRVFARQALNLDGPQVKLLLEGFPEMGRALAEEARRFDPEVSAAYIFQASRNAWVAGGLQVLLGRRMELTPAIFGYSMLYPYTDNHLDDPTAPRDAKREFNRRFRLRLRGERVEAASGRERKAWGLVERIESQYGRGSSPGVYRSLLAIQEAQETSVGLRREARLKRAELLRGVFAKGGASVLADGYLAAGTLEEEEEEFAFGWGVLLQLGDDLQDVADDLAGGAATLFSESAERQPLDGLTSRVFEFGERVFTRLRAFHAPGAGPLKQLIRRSAATLLITAAGTAHQLYTKDYLKALEPHSPFRFAFVREHQQRLFGAGGLLGRLMTAAAD
jgi:hypothetical protein